MRQSPKRIFVDSSLAIACLNLNNETLFEDLNLFGLIFENFVLHDLKIYINHLNGQIFHYRDNSNLEVDAIVVKDGK
ncbi:hypothetical protein FACS1894166_09220 [Bacilli bacterium]|nr:hypothetical protein FACS1894166_09220 [Bacilli bacterium]